MTEIIMKLSVEMEKTGNALTSTNCCKNVLFQEFAGMLSKHPFPA